MTIFKTKMLGGNLRSWGQRVSLQAKRGEWALLQAEAFGDQALEAGLVEDVEGEFFVGKHVEHSALAAGDQFGSFFDGEVFVLTEDAHDHAHHDAEAAQLAVFFFEFGWGLARRLSTWFQVHDDYSVAAPCLDERVKVRVAFLRG